VLAAALLVLLAMTATSGALTACWQDGFVGGPAIVPRIRATVLVPAQPSIGVAPISAGSRRAMAVSAAISRAATALSPSLMGAVFPGPTITAACSFPTLVLPIGHAVRLGTPVALSRVPQVLDDLLLF